MEHRGEAGIFREMHAVVVPVGDMERSRRFYEKILGLTPVKALPGHFMTVYGTGGPTHVCLYVPEPGTERPGHEGRGSFPNFRCDDVETVRNHLLEHGVECSEIGEGGSLRWFRFADPDGNRLDVCEYGPDWLP
jgi:catechol 2,3-dioxygenase-like lactoylglutathione lyase family enzyme